MFGLAPLLLILPLLGFLFNAFAGYRFVENNRENGEKWSGWVAAGASLSAFIVTLALLIATRAAPDAPHIVYLFDWINVASPEGVPDFYVPWEMQIDTLSVTMLMVITGVGSLIHIYAIGYMHGDENFSRFFAYLNLFMFFMIMLVTGSSYLTLFVGWEGVGLASFLLIGFWFSKDKIVVDGDRKIKQYEGVVNSNAARKAFVANRVGDLCMIVAMSLTFWVFGSLRFVEVFDQAIKLTDGSKDYLVEAVVPILGSNVQVPFISVVSLITLLFLLGAAGKSAQLPLFVWLPDAMAGPTPVSALMHAATMVTSGIYLLVRSNVLLEIVRQAGQPILFGQTSADLVALVGAATALYAGLIAFTQFDIKKVLAYSTVSQLGFMIAAVGMGAYVAAMFHLITHAFFKALLFMGAGSVIHGMEHGHHHLHDHHGHDDHHGDDHHGHDHHDDHFDPQDMRYMGGLLKKMPITGTTYIIGALALSGIFPLAGFWSKDEILLHAGANGFTAVNVILTAAAFCTAFYMGRQLKMVFFGQPRHEAVDHVPESTQVMTRPLVILAILSILGGLFLNQPYFSEANARASGYGKVLDGFAKGHDEHHEEHGDDHAEPHMQMAAIGTNHCAAGHGEPHPLDGNFQPLLLEHWLEPSITSFCLSEGEHPLLHLPHTPPVFSLSVAGLSTIIAVFAMAGSFFFVYGGNSPKSSDEKDPIFRIPGFGIMSELPLNTLYSMGFRNAFNMASDFTAHVIDWAFFHDFFHNNILREAFLRLSRFASNVLDGGLVDGTLVLGSGRFIRGISNALKQIQSGYVRNYALTLFLGVVALVVYFVFMVG